MLKLAPYQRNEGYILTKEVQAPRRGFLKTGSEIVKRETPLGLYKGLGAVLTGIVPKMAIRFTSYEWYKQLLADSQGTVTGKSTFLGKFSSTYGQAYRSRGLHLSTRLSNL